MKLQRFPLDRRAAIAYLALTAAGCAPNYGPTLRTVLPAGLAPAARDSVLAWVGRTEPTSNQGHRFKWSFKSPDEGVGGGGNARIAPPDSLRLDMAGPLGAKRTSAMVLGDTALWVSRKDVIEKIIPSYPLLWAMLGVARRPPDAAELTGSVADSLTAWQYVFGADTVEYVRNTGTTPGLTALVRQAGQVVGRVETVFGPDGALVSSRLYLPQGPSRLELTFTENTTPASFKPEIWNRPER
ncbi:MAG: hypothetical protein ACJ8B6_03380 [Gemmatimonadales bacterium]